MLVLTSLLSFYVETNVDSTVYYICIVVGDPIIRGKPMKLFNLETLLYPKQGKTWLFNVICRGLLSVRCLAVIADNSFS